MDKPKVGVIGGGKWGQALHSAFLQRCDSIIYSRTPKEIVNFAPLNEVLERKLLILVLPAQAISSWMAENFVDYGQSVLVAAKGIDLATSSFLNEILSKYLPDERVAFLSGPSFASEVIKSLPTALVINSTCTNLANTYAEIFPDFIKTYASDDVVGAEVCGAYKNIIAIASGVCDGLELGENARASLISRGLVEMARFGRFFGANDKTFLGLSGAGDLFLTASSRLSRNYRVGLGLAHGKKLQEILDELGEVAEGVLTSYAVKNISDSKNIYTPIASEVVALLDGKDPLESVKDLLSKS